MEPLEVASWVVHSVFAGLWTGSVLFLTFGVLPLGRDGTLNATPLESFAGKITTISRVSALALLATGLHMAVTEYDRTRLLETEAGWLVLSMIGLWFFLMGAIEIGGKKLSDGTERDKVRAPAREARPFFLVASLLSLLLLVNAGLISAWHVGAF
jgi:hypothetical protein